MANKKLSQLPETLALITDDIFPVVINTDTVPETKKIKFSNLEISLHHGAIGGLSDDDHTQYFNSTRHTLLVHTNLGLVPNTRKIVSGAGFSGGGDLSVDRTLDIGAGFGILVGNADISINTETNYTWTGNHTFQAGLNTRHLTPELTDTYDLGSSNLLWRKGWLSELDTILFAKNTVTLLGGWFMISKGEGTLNQEVSAATTTIDFGQVMAPNDFVFLRSSLQVEYIKVGAWVHGYIYNVTRDIDGSGANTWAEGTPYAILGNTGNGRIELNAYDTPRISILEQGATYNAQTERIRIGDLAAWQGAGFTGYGIAIGNYSGGESLVYSPTGGLEVRGTIKADDGYLQNLTVQGLLSLNTSGELRAGTTTNGLRFGYLTDGYYLRGIGGGKTQVEIKASDGRFYAGGGRVAIDETGLKITPYYSGLNNEKTSLKWSSNFSSQTSAFLGVHQSEDGEMTPRDYTQLNLSAGTDGDSYGIMTIYARSNNASPEEAFGIVINGKSGIALRALNSSGLMSTTVEGNLDVDDKFGYGYGNITADGFIFPGKTVSVRVSRTTAQSTTNNTWANISWSSSRWDDRPSGVSAHWTSGTRVYCRVSGIYVITGLVGFDSNNTGLRHIGIKYNGDFIAVERENAEQNEANIMSSTTIWKLNAGDYLELAIKQNSGGSLSTYVGTPYWAPEFTMIKVA